MIPPKVLDKLEKRVARLREWRYAKVADVPLEMTDTMKHLRTPPEQAKYEPAPVGCTWGRHWGTVWFRGTAAIPKSCRGRRVYYRHESAAEKLLFLDGKPFAGMDHKHPEVLVLPYARGGEKLSLDVEAYCGHPFPGVDAYDPSMRTLHSITHTPHTAPPLPLESSEILVERDNVSTLHYEADVLLRTAKILDDNSRRRAVILDELNTALDMVPLHWRSDEELESAARAAHKQLVPLLKQSNAPSAPSLGLVGHAHIDIAWLWPLKESIRKAARTFSTVLTLMDDYGEFRFVQSQPVLYQMIEDHYPELLPRIKKRVKEGRWEPNGGMWVEADCNVSGGEALVRQFLEGRKKTLELFGYSGDTLWLPDVFGYSAALPQILKGCGIDSFVTSKINWNDTNRFPYDTFWWRGIDGTEVFTHFLTNRDNGYNAEVCPEIFDETWSYVQQKELQDRTLLSVGWGDGGGGPTREMIERASRMKDLEGCPKSEFVNVSLFLRQMREQKIARPRWVGELYLELHRGTYTTQARTKRYNRKLELLLRETELFAVMAMPHGFEYPSAALQKHWRTLLTNQFHDVLPGTSIRKVYETLEEECAAMEEELRALRNTALGKIGELFVPDTEGTAYLVANALSWSRKDVVVLAAPGFTTAVDAQGNALPCQPVKGGVAIEAPAESMSVSPIALRRTADEAVSEFTYNGKLLDTPHYTLAFDKAGKIVSLLDKAANREVVREGKRLNDFYTAEDPPVYWDAWDIDPDYRSRIRDEDRLVSREVVADGPLFLTLRSQYDVGRDSSITQDMTFYAGSPRIDFVTEVDWHEKHTLLKVGFPLAVHTDRVRCEIQFGHAMRNTHSNTSWDQAQFEVCAHKWVDLSEGDYGVALLNDCKYGHDTLDDMLSLTLLRSPLAPDETADQGHHEFTYALLPHQGGFSTDTVVREAYELNVPLTALRLTSTTGAGTLQSLDFCAVDNPNVVVEAVKKAERDGAVVVRVYEAGNTRGPVRLSLGRPLKKATECNLMEERDSAAKFREDCIEFDIRPFEIKTFKVYFR